MCDLISDVITYRD